METLYLFNPENDMALACGNPYYMPPASACRMAAELSVLPAWYAPAGAAVWADSFSRVEKMKAQCALLPPVRFVCEGVSAYGKVSPWGWNPALLRRLHEAGMVASAYPSESAMQRIRALSGRHTAVGLLQRLRKGRLAGSLVQQGIVGESFLFYSVDDVARFVRRHRAAVLKAPWSGSGRGIRYASQGMFPSGLQGWVERVLRTQQAVVGEPWYDKVVDFAMEFRSDGAGGVCFAGYSWFETDKCGIYKENLLASDAAIERRLSAYVPASVLHAVRQCLEEELATVIGSDYQGYLGVDMMVCRTPEGYAAHPCVEINLRMSMGIVARMVCDRYVHPLSGGRYVIEHYARCGDAVLADAEMRRCHPLQMESGVLRAGYLSLTPVDESTAYQVYVIVGPVDAKEGSV